MPREEDNRVGDKLINEVGSQRQLFAYPCIRQSQTPRLKSCPLRYGKRGGGERVEVRSDCRGYASIYPIRPWRASLLISARYQMHNVYWFVLTWLSLSYEVVVNLFALNSIVPLVSCYPIRGIWWNREALVEERNCGAKLINQRVMFV